MLIVLPIKWVIPRAIIVAGSPKSRAAGMSINNPERGTAMLIIESRLKFCRPMMIGLVRSEKVITENMTAG